MHNDFISIVARIGLFFAHCDGEYHPKERSFIRRFLINLQTKGLVNDEDIKELETLQNETPSLEQITEESADFLLAQPVKTRAELYEMMKQFIESVIKADGVLQQEENDSFDFWKHHINNILK